MGSRDEEQRRLLPLKKRKVIATTSTTTVASSRPFEVFSPTRHYHRLYSALCRQKRNETRLAVCQLCANAYFVNQYFRHCSRSHPLERERCMSCGDIFHGQTVSFVYTHLSLCLFGENIPTERVRLTVDRAELRRLLDRNADQLTPLQRTFSRLLRDNDSDSSLRYLLAAAKQSERLRLQGQQQQRRTYLSLGSMAEDSWCVDWSVVFQLQQQQQRTFYRVSDEAFDRDLDHRIVNLQRHRCRRNNAAQPPQSAFGSGGDDDGGDIPFFADFVRGDSSAAVILARAPVLVGTIMPSSLRLSDDNGNEASMSCLACDLQRDHYVDGFCDRWPTIELAGHHLSAYQFPRDRLVHAFLSNDRFRGQYERVPAWLMDSLSSDQHQERLQFARTGLSTVMAGLLRAAFESADMVLRHVYVYEFMAQNSLEFLLSHTADYYVFPFSCLCADECLSMNTRANVFRELADTVPQTGLLSELFHELVRGCGRVVGSSGRRASPVSEKTQQQRQQQQQAKRLHRSVEWLRRRSNLVHQLLDYVATYLSRPNNRVNTMLCHRHVIVCSRTEDAWKRVCKLFAHRFFTPLYLREVELAKPLSEARQAALDYLLRSAKLPVYTLCSNRLQNLPHVFNTVAYVSRPTQPFRTDNFYRTMGDLQKMVSTWTGCEPLSTDRARIVKLMAQRMLGVSRSKTVSGGGGGVHGTTTVRMQLLSRVGRYFLYEVLTGNASVDLPLRQHFQRFVQSYWQPRGWEDDHFYIATPLLEHGLVLYWSLVDGCLVEQLNLMFAYSEFRNRRNDLAHLVCRSSRHQFYTRLGYIFAYFFSHYPLEHRLPLLPGQVALVMKTRDSSVGLRFSCSTETQTSSVKLLGDLFDLIIPLSDPNNRDILEHNRVDE